MSSESERIRHGYRKISLHRLVRSIVQVAFRLDLIKIDGRRHDSVLEGKDGSNSLNGTGCTKHVTDRAFYRADMSLVGIISQSQFESLGLADIIQGRTCTMGIYIKDII